MPLRRLTDDLHERRVLLDERAENLGRKARRRHRLDVVMGMLALALSVIGVWAFSYLGRVELVHSQRMGCERGKLDRRANAEGWRIAQAARRAQGQPVVAARYAAIARQLEGRSRIDCAATYPTPNIFGR